MSTVAAVAIAGAFGVPMLAKDIGHLIKNFDFSKMQDRASESHDFLNVALAPSFGSLTSETIKLMDDRLKVIIAGTTRAIANLEDKSWRNVVAMLNQNPLLEPHEDEIYRVDQFIKAGTNAFKFPGIADGAVIREVEAWFANLISDSDVLRSTGIDIYVLAKLVASTGARVHSFQTIFGKHKCHEQTMLEIGVLRYPDIEQPYFKVYRLQLKAWADCKRVMMVQRDYNGITGEFRVRKYKPRDSVISGMKEEVRQMAVQDAEDLFA